MTVEDGMLVYAGCVMTGAAALLMISAARGGPLSCRLAPGDALNIHEINSQMVEVQHGSFQLSVQ